MTQVADGAGRDADPGLVLRFTTITEQQMPRDLSTPVVVGRAMEV
jgi:hypothetical protein